MRIRPSSVENLRNFNLLLFNFWEGLFLQVGYPNVGKSSTINALLNEKKVAVSVTPGRTKHFQVITVPFI